jgi:hypothetical protein
MVNFTTTTEVKPTEKISHKELKKSSFLDRKGYDEKKNNKTTSLQQLF